MKRALTWLSFGVSLAALPLALPAQAPRAAAPTHPLTLQSVVLTIPAETGQPALSFTLDELMRIYKVPGLSVAWVENNRLAWAKGFGVTGPGSTTPVTPDTLFQAASISKPVTAAGGLWLVEHGKLNLDSDINQSLKSWKVPGNSYTAKAKVTLRGLMSHNAGFNVHGFAGYAQGTPIPTTLQTLDGVAPANNPPIRVIAVPGTQCIYSGGGVTIEGLLIKEASGQRFEDFMRQHVLLPAGMTSSTFEQDLPPALASKAALGTHADGTMVPGKWHIYPELAPDGLWSTPSDLARFAIEISKSRDGQANHILSTAMTREMLTPQCHDTPGDAGGVGLGFGVGYHGYPGQFHHNGANEGFESYLFMDADRGWGVALMGDSDAFESIYSYVAETLARAHGGPYVGRAIPLSDKLTLVNAKLGAQAAVARFQQARKEHAEEANSSVPLNVLGYQLLAGGKTDDAIRVFQRNTVLFPKDANTYDSLAEAYAKAGKKDLAIRNYRKSLALNPKNDNARAQLKKLGR